MEDIIKKILTIDRTAKEIVQTHERDTKIREEIAKNELSQMKVEAIEKAKAEGQHQYDEKIRVATLAAEGICAQGNALCQQVEAQYIAIKHKMEALLFEKVFMDYAQHENENPSTDPHLNGNAF